MEWINPSAFDTSQLGKGKGKTEVATIVTRPEDDPQTTQQTVVVEGRTAQTLTDTIKQYTIKSDQDLLIRLDETKGLELSKVGGNNRMAVVEQADHEHIFQIPDSRPQACLNFGCADGTIWHYQGWVGVFVEGYALHATR